MSETLLVAAVVVGPSLAAAVWLAVAPWRALRRTLGGLLALGSVAAAWAVVWSAYRGGQPAWRGLAPDLLQATIVSVAFVGIALAALRAERLAPRAAPGAVAALGVATSALAAGAYARNLALVGVFLVVPTLAAFVASLGAARPALPGIATLAAADVAAIAGLSIVYSRTETVTLAPAAGLGVALLLGAAAAKAGALPGLATARLSAAGADGGLLAAVIRAQGVALAALAALELSAPSRSAPLVAAAAAAMLLSGVRAALARTASGAVSGLVGAAAGVPFLALGLGGATGVRAFLLAAPALVLASALVEALVPDAADDIPTPSPRLWRWAGLLALGIGVGSLAAVPPGGGFPGMWLALALGVTRSMSEPLVLLAVGGAAAGLGMALVAAAPLVRAALARPVLSTAGLLASFALVYLGSQPVRLGVGWWLRVEAGLGLPRLLPSAGAPEIPAAGGMALLLAAAPAVALVLAVAALGRGLRDAPAAFPAPVAARARRRRGEARPFSERLAARSALLVDRSRALGIGLAAVLVVAAAALALAGRLVWSAARGGFL